MDKQLTVVITTYNRREPLLKQLKSLEKQGMYDKYSIIISDNCSNYDVDTWLNENLSYDFRAIVHVHHNKYNIGGDCNIARTFELCETNWMWMLSDDDITEPDSLSIILKDIDTYKDVCWIKYSIAGNFKPLDNIRISSLEELFTYFSRNGHTAGEMVFMSNNLYNMNLLKPYLGIAQQYQTCMTQLMPPFCSIQFDAIPALLSSNSVVSFTPGNASYSSLHAWVNFGNLIYSNLNMSSRQIKAFKNISFMPTNGIIKILMNIDNKNLRYEYFKKMFIAHYNIFSIKGLYLWFLFHFFHLTNISPSKIRNCIKQ